jgi:ADP-ribose pyrophosphatase YjhB (NUDIX family)
MEIKYNKSDLEEHKGVSAVIRNSEGDVLMQEHVKYGFWTIPVGKTKKGQSVIDAIKEEVFEECNLVIEDLREIAIREIEYVRNGKKMIVPAYVFEVLKYSGEVKNKEPEKHKQQKFMSIEEIKNLPYISHSTVMFLESVGIMREARIYD